MDVADILYVFRFGGGEMRGGVRACGGGVQFYFGSRGSGGGGYLRGRGGGTGAARMFALKEGGEAKYLFSRLKLPPRHSRSLSVSKNL